MTFDYILVEDTLAIHEDQIERYGGAHGVRDPGLLEAALFRPQTGYYETLIDEAAALWESLSQSHPFVDGNKRTAFVATFVFLTINGLNVTASDEDSQALVLELYDAGAVNFANLQSWILNNTART